MVVYAIRLDGRSRCVVYSCGSTFRDDVEAG
jgi:hypothetical protein